MGSLKRPSRVLGKLEAWLGVDYSGDMTRVVQLRQNNSLGVYVFYSPVNGELEREILGACGRKKRARKSESKKKS